MQVGKRYFGSFSNRLSLRITAIVLLMMTLMGVGMVSWSLYVTNIFNKNYFQVLMDVTNETIENELTGVEVATTYAARDMEREPPFPSGQQTKSQRTVKPVIPGPLAMQRTGRNTSRTRSSEALGTCVVC